MAKRVMEMEQTLKVLNEEKSKDDQETAALKKKLAIFETKMRQLEEEKKFRDQVDNADGLKEKLYAMEEKLVEMERAKAVSSEKKMQREDEMALKNHIKKVGGFLFFISLSLSLSLSVSFYSFWIVFFLILF